VHPGNGGGLMTKAAAKAGVDPTMTVAIKQHFPADRRIVDHDLAYRIMRLGMGAFVWLMRRIARQPIGSA
jgi:hypothetical protein